jgi:hypothetical protein
MNKLKEDKRFLKPLSFYVEQMTYILIIGIHLIIILFIMA